MIGKVGTAGPEVGVGVATIVVTVNGGFGGGAAAADATSSKTVALMADTANTALVRVSTSPSPS
jgi:hypothetical protein